MNTYTVTSSELLESNSSHGYLKKWCVGDTYIKASSVGRYESYGEVIASNRQ